MLDLRSKRGDIRMTRDAALEIGASGLAKIGIYEDIDTGGSQHASGVDHTLEAKACAVTGCSSPGVNGDTKRHGRHTTAHRRRIPAHIADIRGEPIGRSI